MVLLRRVIGDALRARRQGQHRTLREVSSAANVSLGYLSEIERGQKEASSELLAAICDALGARLSELLRDVSDTVELAEGLPGVLVPVQGSPVAEPVPQSAAGEPARQPVAVAPVRSEPLPQPAPVDPALARPVLADRAVRALAEGGVRAVPTDVVRQIAVDGALSVTVRQESLKATLRTNRRIRPDASPERDVVCVG